MDIVYNDLEELYPFVNKVHPHSRLAAIAIRSLLSLRNRINKDARLSITALARLAAFLVTDGKYFMLGRLLGKEPEAPARSEVKEGTTSKALPGAEDLEDFLSEIGLSLRMKATANSSRRRSN